MMRCKVLQNNSLLGSFSSLTGPLKLLQIILKYICFDGFIHIFSPMPRPASETKQNKNVIKLISKTPSAARHTQVSVGEWTGGRLSI